MVSPTADRNCNCLNRLASRRYWYCLLVYCVMGCLVFIGTYEDEHHIRGLARGIPEFYMYRSPECAADLLGKVWRMPAGGFIAVENLSALRSRLSILPISVCNQEHLKKLLLKTIRRVASNTNHQPQMLDTLIHGIENLIQYSTPNIR